MGEYSTARFNVKATPKEFSQALSLVTGSLWLPLKNEICTISDMPLRFEQNGDEIEFVEFAKNTSWKKTRESEKVDRLYRALEYLGKGTVTWTIDEGCGSISEKDRVFDFSIYEGMPLYSDKEWYEITKNSVYIFSKINKYIPSDKLSLLMEYTKYKYRRIKKENYKDFFGGTDSIVYMLHTLENSLTSENLDDYLSPKEDTLYIKGSYKIKGIYGFLNLVRIDDNDSAILKVVEKWRNFYKEMETNNKFLEKLENISKNFLKENTCVYYLKKDNVFSLRYDDENHGMIEDFSILTKNGEVMGYSYLNYKKGYDKNSNSSISFKSKDIKEVAKNIKNRSLLLSSSDLFKKGIKG